MLCCFEMRRHIYWTSMWSMCEKILFLIFWLQICFNFLNKFEAIQNSKFNILKQTQIYTFFKCTFFPSETRKMNNFLMSTMEIQMKPRIQKKTLEPNFSRNNRNRELETKDWKGGKERFEFCFVSFIQNWDSFK